MAQDGFQDGRSCLGNSVAACLQASNASVPSGISGFTACILADQLFDARPSGLARPTARWLVDRIVQALRVSAICRRRQVAEKSRQVVPLEHHPRLELAFREQDIAKDGLCSCRKGGIGDVCQGAEHVAHDALAARELRKRCRILRAAGKRIAFTQILGDGLTFYGEEFCG